MLYHNFHIGVPSLGKYVEVFNSDSIDFGGSGQCNSQPINVQKEPYHNQRYSMEITVPPLAISIFMKQTKIDGGECLNNGFKKMDCHVISWRARFKIR